MSTYAYHILVVDDDEILRIGVCDLLELAGYNVSFAVNGADGLDVLKRMARPPALIISDIRMPKMNGYEFLHKVREHPEWISIPFIFLSAKGEREDIYQGKLRGADDYITKPFEFQDLLVAIQSSLRRASELNKLQESRLNALKIHILDVMNHEFRTPLTYISAYADLMANSPSFKHSDELRQYINGIMEGSDRLTKLIHNFLTLAELESGLGEKIFERRKQKLPRIDTLVQNVVNVFQADLKSDAVTIAVEIAANPVPVIEADANYLQVALNQLMDNAIKFTQINKGSEVRVSITSDETSVMISFEDSGPGISDKDQERLFDVFFQIDREKTEQRGTGSGLAIVRHIARLHNGQVRLNSSEGKGSTFIFQVPIMQEQQEVD